MGLASLWWQNEIMPLKSIDSEISMEEIYEEIDFEVNNWKNNQTQIRVWLFFSETFLPPQNTFHSQGFYDIPVLSDYNSQTARKKHWTSKLW